MYQTIMYTHTYTHKNVILIEFTKYNMFLILRLWNIRFVEIATVLCIVLLDLYYIMLCN